MRNIARIELKKEASLVVIVRNFNYNVYINGHIYIVNKFTGDIVQFDDDSFVLDKEYVTNCIEEIRKIYPDF